MRSKLAQRFGDISRRLITILRLLLHHLDANPFQFARYVGTAFADWWWHFTLVFRDPLSQTAVGERRFAGQQKVERAPQPVDVSTMVHRVAVERLFGGEVIGGAQNVFVVHDRQGFLFLGGDES